MRAEPLAKQRKVTQLISLCGYNDLSCIHLLIDYDKLGIVSVHFPSKLYNSINKLRNNKLFPDFIT